MMWDPDSRDTARWTAATGLIGSPCHTWIPWVAEVLRAVALKADCPTSCQCEGWTRPSEDKFAHRPPAPPDENGGGVQPPIPPLFRFATRPWCATFVLYMKWSREKQYVGREQGTSEMDSVIDPTVAWRLKFPRLRSRSHHGCCDRFTIFLVVVRAADCCPPRQVDPGGSRGRRFPGCVTGPRTGREKARESMTHAYEAAKWQCVACLASNARCNGVLSNLGCWVCITAGLATIQAVAECQQRRSEAIAHWRGWSGYIWTRYYVRECFCTPVGEER